MSDEVRSLFDGITVAALFVGTFGMAISGSSTSFFIGGVFALTLQVVVRMVIAFTTKEDADER